MPDVEITLSIIAETPNGYPPMVKDGKNKNKNGEAVAADPKDRVPWRKAQWRRSELPGGSSLDIGFRPKKKGYFYRFTGGNTEFLDNDNPGTGPSLGPVNDGDFEFKLGRGRKTVKIQMDQESHDEGWRFDSVNLTHPLYQTNSLPIVSNILADNKVEIDFDTNDRTRRSGQIGMVVKLPKNAQGNAGNKDVYLYVDPDWNNRWQ